jgi:hypothetical protein
VLSDVAEVALRTRSDLNRSEAAKNLMCKIRMGVGLVTYLVADLSSGLQGFGGASFAMFCDPCRPGRPHSTSRAPLGVATLRGVCDDCLSVTAALRDVSAGGIITALGDLALRTRSVPVVDG